MLRGLTAAAALAFVLVQGGIARADQSDLRLDRLFAQLQIADSPAQARVFEQLIWSIWLEPPEESVGETLRLGITAMRRGDLAGALDAFTQVVEASPDFAEGWNRRASVNFMLGDLDASEADAEHALALEPRHFGALAGLARIDVVRMDDYAALKTYEQALLVNPHLNSARRAIQRLRKTSDRRDV